MKKIGFIISPLIFVGKLKKIDFLNIQRIPNMLTKKRVVTVWLTAFMTFGLSLVATAQVETTFESNTLYKLQDEARRATDQGTLRLTILKEHFENGNTIPVSTEKYISEVIPPDRRRFITEIKSKTGIRRSEFINIGTQRYIKENGGKWEVYQPKGGGGSGQGSGNGSGGEQVKIESSSVNKLERDVIVNNQKTDYYETTVNYKFFYPTGTVTAYSKKGFWFDAQGRYVRTLKEDFSGDTKSLSREITDYEYNPDIKIEAPM